MSQKKTTVVIPNYNGKKYIGDCLSFLHRSKGTIFDTIVVDNGSTDGSLALVKDQFPWVKVIAFSDNTGFSKAVNAGILEADTEFVILLNNDTVVEPDFVVNLEKAISNRKKAFSVSAQLVNMKQHEILDDAGDFYCALGWSFARGKGKEASYYKKPCRIFSACAGAAIYKRELLCKIGLFDEAHFAYLEDVDVGYRARLYGYENYYEPSAVVYHAGSASSGSRYNAFKVDLSSRNSIYLIAKNMPFLQILLNLPFFLIGYAIKTAFFFQKGLGMVYVKGLFKGFKLSLSKQGREKKVKVRPSFLGIYLRIQLELWWNIIRRFLDV